MKDEGIKDRRERVKCYFNSGIMIKIKEEKQEVYQIESAGFLKISTIVYSSKILS